MRDIGKYLTLFFLFLIPSMSDAQTVNGNMNAAFAVGKWKESHEGVSLYCARITTQKEVLKGNSNGACFLTEAQATAKDSVVMSTNTFAVTQWDEHGLTAISTFYADEKGNQTSESSPGAIKFAFRIVLKFEAHQMTKFVERGDGSTSGYHLEDQ
jgi:hypothetical protein